MNNKPFTETRPWGEFRQYIHDEQATVKTILVKKGEEFSLQYHAFRSEFWKILSGHPEVTVGEAIFKANPGDEFEVPANTKHRVHAIDDEVMFLEIATGKFDEADITRLEDDYGRS